MAETRLCDHLHSRLLSCIAHVLIPQGWEMAAVLMASLPILAGAGGWMAVNLSSLTTIGEKSYRSAGGVAEQAVSGIRTVQSLSGEERENERYSYQLGEALKTGLRKARINGMGFGIVMGSFIGTYALGLWFGSWLIINNKYNTSTGKTFSGGDVIMCFFAVVMGSFSVGQVMPAFQAFTKGRASAGRIWDVIERKPPIDVRDQGGEKPAEVKGDIEFKNVAFTYPARAEAPIFQNLSISVKQGQEVALVGASGSGKSTIIQVRTLQFLHSAAEFGCYSPGVGFRFRRENFRPWQHSAPHKLAFIQPAH
jgi:ATP-binding cassette subfamily B (MDR/TAP) protein 1